MACKGSKPVRAMLNKCVNCKNSQSRPSPGPEPSDLPKFCLGFDYEFCYTGVDFAGLRNVKDIYGKNDQMCIINKVNKSLYILSEKDDKISNKYCIFGITFQSPFSK